MSLTLCVLTYAFMQMMVIPALPQIQADLQVGPGAVAWTISAFLLSTAVATPILGRLGDMYGKERVLVAVLLIFAAGCVIGALAPSIELLIVARALQGTAGAVFPLSFGLARDTLPAERVPMAIGILSGSFGLGGAAGLVLSGLLVDHLSWHAIFWFGALMPAVAITGVVAFVPASPARARVRLDWIGAALLALGLLGVLVAISRAPHWGVISAPTLALGLGGAGVLAAFARVELRREHPFADLRLFAQRGVWTVNVAAVLIGFGMYANGYLVPQFVQTDPAAAGYGFDASVTAAAMFMLPATFVGLMAGPAAGMLQRRYDPRLPLVAGALIMTTGFLLLAFAHDHRWEIYLGAALTYGLGLSLAYAAMGSLITMGVPAEQTGEAGGINTMMRTVGGSLGSQVVAATVAAGAVGGGVPAEHGFTASFATCAVVVLGAAAVATAIPLRRAALAPAP